jgi:prepilin-type processing-associated H-X9-DG protein
MWFKILLIVLIVAVLLLIWWNNKSNIAYFDGSSIFQIPAPLFTKGQQDMLSFAIKFPATGAPNGIVLFMRAGDKFMIAYVQDGKLLINKNNDQNLSLVFSSLGQEWINFTLPIDDVFKDVPVYFGGAPAADQIPVNTLVFEGQSDVIQFPTANLKACINDCYLNNVNLSALIQKQGYRTYC